MRRPRKAVGTVAIAIAIAIVIAVATVGFVMFTQPGNGASTTPKTTTSSQSTSSSSDTTQDSTSSSPTSSSSGQTTENGSGPPPSTCTTTFPDGLSMTEGGAGLGGNYSAVRLFSMQPNSVALLCVSYPVEPGGVLNTTFSGGAYAEDIHCSQGGCASGNVTKAPGVSVTPSPTSAIGAEEEQVHFMNVTYTIRTSSNSEGFYNLDYSLNCPFLVPFAILGQGQQPTGSDFGGFFQVYDCAISGGLENGFVTGVAGMNVGWIYSNSSLVTATSTPNENCPANYNGFGSADENQTYPVYPVLSMPTNATGFVCLTYHNPTNATQKITVTGLEVGYFSAQPTRSGIDSGYNISFNASSDFMSTPNATSVTLAPGASHTVAFLVHSDTDSKGFFYLGAPAGNESCSMGIPLAVGYTFTAQNKSGPYWNPQGAEWNCVTWAPPRVYSTILSFVGIQQTYVGCGGYICDQASSYGTFAPRA